MIYYIMVSLCIITYNNILGRISWSNILYFQSLSYEKMYTYRYLSKQITKLDIPPKKSYYTNFVQLLDLLCIVSSWTYKLLFIGSSWSGFCKKSPFRYYKSFDRVSDTINHLIGSPRDCGFLKIPSDTINHMIGSPRDCGFLKIPSDTINHLIWSPCVLRD